MAQRRRVRRPSRRLTLDDAWRRDIEAVTKAYLREHGKGTVRVVEYLRGGLEISLTLPHGAAYHATVRHHRARSGCDWYVGFVVAVDPGVHDREERWAGAYLIPPEGERPSLWPCQVKLWARDDESLFGAVRVGARDGSDAGETYAIEVPLRLCGGFAEGSCTRVRR